MVRDVTLYLFAFAGSGLVVVLAAVALARFADQIAEATRLGRLWVGSVLLAAATSLPELTTDIAAVRMGAVDLAVGDLFGSSMANMLILSVIDLLPPRGRVLQRAAIDHALAASLAIGLNAMAAALVFIHNDASLFWIGPGSLLLAVSYLAAARVVFHHTVGREDAAVAKETEERPRPSLPRAIIGFSLAALVVLAAAPALAWAAKGIAELSGLGNTFVGTWLVGISTSLPELVTCIAAVRMKSYDLAVGNLFGSNALNMAIFVALDAAQPGNIFAALDRGHVLTATFSTLLMSVGLAAIVYRAKKRLAVVEPDSLLMLIIYGFAMWSLYRFTV